MQKSCFSLPTLLSPSAPTTSRSASLHIAASRKAACFQEEGLRLSSSDLPTGQRHSNHFPLSGRFRTQSASYTPTAPSTSPEAAERAFSPHTESENGMPDSRTHRILSQPSIEGDPLRFLKLSEAFWKAMKSLVKPKAGPDVIKRRNRQLVGQLDYDIVVCGGTLGLLLALSLQLQGWRVCIVEKRLAEGRTQEWNSSRPELQVLVDLGLVTPAELEESIVTEFNPARIEFLGGFSTKIRDILNLGVLPRKLLQHMRRRFLEAGGTIRERCAFLSADVFDNGVNIRVSGPGAQLPIDMGDSNRPLPALATASPPQEEGQAGNGHQRTATPSSGHSSPQGNSGAKSGSSTRTEIRARLVLDCMGHWSPIVKQMRGRQQADGVCLVVGGCAGGVPDHLNQEGDFLRTISHIEDDMQLYWQSFPAAGGKDRTTYMFTYADADRRRPSLEALLERYLDLLPQVCGCNAEDLQWRRMLFAGQPCYRSAPTQPQFDRILQIGDASGSHSPLSFGGFGSMLRHLGRLNQGIHAALQQDALDVGTLKGLQPYQPSLSASWLFQRSMSLRIGQAKAKAGPRGRVAEGAWLPPNHINRLMSCNFACMQALGQWVLRPFVQDNLQWGPLSLTMAAMLLKDPLVVIRVVAQVGPAVLLDWFRHYVAFTAYALLTRLAALVSWLPFLKHSFRWQRWRNAWAYGAGLEDSLPHHGSPAADAAQQAQAAAA